MPQTNENEDVEESTGTNLEVYFQLIGDRVHAIRSKRGMARKLLSKESNISERYLAQIENGTANMSISKLWKIADAMGVSIIDLLPDGSGSKLELTPLYDFLSDLSLAKQKDAYTQLLKHFSNNTNANKGIALIGLRGAGKSTIGEALAKEMGLDFIKLGDVIEKLSSMDIIEIFSLGGQKTYRRYEKHALEYVIENHSDIVLEVGGSIVSEKETLNLLLSTFYTVWLKAKPEDHMNRVINQGDFRPIIGNTEESMQDLKNILEERERYYQAADLTFDTSDRNISECVKQIADKCRTEIK